MGSRSKESGWSRWRRGRRLKGEAKHIARETRRILRVHRGRLRQEIVDEVREALAALDEAMAGERLGLQQKRIDQLERLLEKHLAFARKSAVREYTESIGAAVIIALLLRAFVVEAFKIPSGSMIPTLEVGDHIFVNKFIHGLLIPFTDFKIVHFRSPERGEIIVFRFPQDESKDFIKRVVAVGGDTIELRQNRIVLNGTPIQRRRLPGPCTYTDEEEGTARWHPKRCVAFEEELGGTRYRVIQDVRAIPMDRAPEKIPEGHVFVMGDNRDNSHDSRYWGTVREALIKGKAMIIWWSSGEPDGIRWSRFFELVHGSVEDAPDPSADRYSTPITP